MLPAVQKRLTAGPHAGNARARWLPQPIRPDSYIATICHPTHITNVVLLETRIQLHQDLFGQGAPLRESTNLVQAPEYRPVLERAPVVHFEVQYTGCNHRPPRHQWPGFRVGRQFHAYRQVPSKATWPLQ